VFQQDLYPTLKYMEYETETEASSMVSVSQGICQFNNWNSNQASPSNDDWDSNKTSPSNDNWNSNQKSFSSDVQEKSLNINSSLIIETWPEEEAQQWHRLRPNNQQFAFTLKTFFLLFGLISIQETSRSDCVSWKKVPTAEFFSFWLDFFGK